MFKIRPIKRTWETIALFKFNIFKLLIILNVVYFGECETYSFMKPKLSSSGTILTYKQCRFTYQKLQEEQQSGRL